MPFSEGFLFRKFIRVIRLAFWFCSKHSGRSVIFCNGLPERFFVLEASTGDFLTVCKIF